MDASGGPEGDCGGELGDAASPAARESELRHRNGSRVDPEFEPEDRDGGGARRGPQPERVLGAVHGGAVLLLNDVRFAGGVLPPAGEGAGGDVFTEGDYQRGELRGSGSSGAPRAARQVEVSAPAGRIPIPPFGIQRLQASQHAPYAVLR